MTFVVKIDDNRFDKVDDKVNDKILGDRRA